MYIIFYRSEFWYKILAIAMLIWNPMVPKVKLEHYSMRPKVGCNEDADSVGCWNIAFLTPHNMLTFSAIAQKSRQQKA